MTQDIIFTANAAKPPASYSHAVTAGGLIFLSRS
jgi:enamine deaminase RidA (YjgF/YER057c/UK114 family)